MVKKGLIDKREILLGFSLLLILLCFALTFAFPGIEISKTAVAAYAGNFNVTEDVTYKFNFTINNTNGLIVTAGSLNVTEVNVTLPDSFLLNSSTNNSDADATTIIFHNYSVGTTMILQWRNASNGYLINGSNHSAWFVFNVTVATPGSYTINLTVLHANATDSVIYNITTYNFNVTVNDTTSPDILATNFVRPVTNFNYTGSLVLNGTVTDNYKTVFGVNYVNVSVYNVTGSLNASYTLKNLSGNYWNVTIDTSQFPDGLYNITIYTNDTSNNLNSTNITHIIFDNTAPTASASCTPSTVNTGNTVTCTCAPSDSTSGVNSSATSITANPSTSNTGTYTQICSFADLAGNTASTTAKYTVEMVSSGGSSTGGGTTSTFTYSKTIPQTSQEFSEVKTIETSTFSGGGLGAKERVTVKLNNEVHYVGVREIKVNSAVIEIASDPVQVELDVGEDAKIDVDNDGYYDIYVKLNSITASKADVTISYLNELKAEGAGAVETGGEVVSGGAGETGAEVGASWNWKWIIIIAIIVIALVVWFASRKK